MSSEDQVVYSPGDYAAMAAALLTRCNGDRAEALRRLLASPCDKKLAEQIGVATASYYGLTLAEFMQIFRRIHRGENFTLP